MGKLRWGAGRSGASRVGVFCTFGIAGCAAPSEDEAVARVHGDLTAPPPNAAALSSGGTCDELLAQLQNALLTQVSERAEQARLSGAPYYGGGVFIDDVVPVSAPPMPVPASAMPASPAPDFATPVGAGAIAPAVGPLAGLANATAGLGIDEGDFVKSDGDRIYVTNGSGLFVLSAASAAATEIEASVSIEGQPVELIVSDGHVVVFSNIYGPLPGSDEVYSPYYYYYPTYTKLTVLDARSEAFDVLRETYVEGYYSYSRSHDGIVRAIVQQYSKAQLDYPNVSYVDIFGHPRSQAEIDLQVDLWALLAIESIEESVLSDYVPNAFERVGGELVKQPLRCGDFLVPGPGLTQAGATSVVALDLGALDAPIGNLTVLGYSDYVYTGTDSLVLRQLNYAQFDDELPRLSTRVHRFALDGASAVYTGSGEISGYVQGQLGLDERDGVIRAVANEERYGTDADAGGYVYLGTETRVLTLAADTLTELGRTADIGGTEEYFNGSQLLADRAYVMHAGSTGRLSVIDLSDPAAPSIAGELSTTGYSSLLYPLSRSLLLGVGQGSDPNGFVQKVGLSLYDVGDASAPSLLHEFVFAQPGYSEALYDRRALTIHPRQNIVALQHQSYDVGTTSLELLRVSSQTGFTHLGSIVPIVADLTLLECLQFLGYPTDPEFLEQLEQEPELAESLLDQCRLYNQEYVRRGLFRGDDVYAIGNLSVTAYALDSLDGPPLSQVVLSSSNGSVPPFPLPLLE
jgi:hypothetical protein